MTKIFPAPEEVRDVNDDNASTEKRSCLYVFCIMSASYVLEEHEQRAVGETKALDDRSRADETCEEK